MGYEALESARPTCLCAHHDMEFPSNLEYSERLSEYLLDRRLRMLIENRIIYPDATIHSLVQRYLREIVRFVVVAALGCIIYEVIKAHGSLSTALADAKADLAKAEATVESLVAAAKKAV